MSEKMRRTLIGILVVVFCVAAVFFGKSLWEYHKGDEIYESAMEYVTEEETVSTEEEEPAVEEEPKKPSIAPVPVVKRTHANIDFASLQAVNEDVFGWIQIFGTQVDYPLLDADDNKYYLKHGYDHRRTAYGSIFLEPRNSAKMNEKHIVIYGHNMVNHSMFGSLVNYKKQAYANNHNFITICMPGQDLTYQVFSAYTAAIDSPTYRLQFPKEGSFDEMIRHMKENSVISSDLTPKEGDQILTLSTCTPAGSKSHRFVVNAVLVSGVPIHAVAKESPAPQNEETEQVLNPVSVEVDNAENELSEEQELQSEMGESEMDSEIIPIEEQTIE